MVKEYKLYLGSHIPFLQATELYGSVQTALNWGENAFMVYLGAPQNTIRKPLNKTLTQQGLDLMHDNNLQSNQLVVHAPYVINLCSSNPSTRQFSVQFLINELKRASEVQAHFLVLHPGSALDQDRETALVQVADGLNQVFANTKGISTIICLETMAGKGSEVGRNLNEMRFIFDHIKDTTRLGLCLDTCHLNDAGYDMQNFDQFLAEFKTLFTYDKIKVIHLNDSKNPLGAHKDRHANIGHGYIGFEALSKIIYHPILDGVVKILETPLIKIEGQKKAQPIYKEEIAMLKNRTYCDWIAKYNAGVKNDE